MTKERSRDEIGDMIVFYKTWKNKLKEANKGIEVSYHDQIIENTKENRIWGKRLWYYQFEEIIGRSPTISPPFLIESDYTHWETNSQDKLYHDKNTQEYKN